MFENLDLFSEVLKVYQDTDEPISNATLYKAVAKKLKLPESLLSTGSPVGRSGLTHNLFKRKVRWYQQTLKQAGILTKVDGKRGDWCIANKKEDGLDKILPNLSVLGFSTKLGIAILGYSEQVFSSVNEPINLIITSPPYPLANPRKYGNVKESEYVDWICTVLEPVIKNMALGASLAINLGNDIFIKGTPARSMYKERLLIALTDRFNLHLMDTLIWHNPSKPPGPIAWASKQRVQLNVAYEPIYWLTNSPQHVRSDNRRVLQPHTEKHAAFIKAGGVKKAAIKSDGSHRNKVGSYSNLTEGRIPRNILTVGGVCQNNLEYKKDAIRQGYTPHGATMPLKLASFCINFMTEEMDLVVDPFAGSFTSLLAAQTLNRRWIGVDPVVDYVAGSAMRFNACDGFTRHLS